MMKLGLYVMKIMTLMLLTFVIIYVSYLLFSKYQQCGIDIVSYVLLIIDFVIASAFIISGWISLFDPNWEINNLVLLWSFIICMISYVISALILLK